MSVLAARERVFSLLNDVVVTQDALSSQTQTCSGKDVYLKPATSKNLMFLRVVGVSGRSFILLCSPYSFDTAQGSGINNAGRTRDDGKTQSSFTSPLYCTYLSLSLPNSSTTFTLPLSGVVASSLLTKAILLLAVAA
ncbi:unnamed protein product [Chondrus crispus]|uniref:Uncharacterized protein n=1 Tax=Chondrus crispus TaxID=2769 RepID=R7QPA1_CHOCR|nr:unnamed protein product [Chondrus crispus]CDF39311.1 unnamed protein product [Chondrus crispus]|eukprot:XP_005719222.1 unnamed protein product [Chondrus crispus]